MESDVIVDTRGFRCPLPVLKARKALQGLAPGATLKVLADDPAAFIDMPHFCREAGHELLSCSDADGILEFTLRKGS